MEKKEDTVQPKTGETHRLFGLRSLKFHKFRDPKWQADDKITQYDGLIRLHEKDLQLKNLQEVAEKKKNHKKLSKLRKEVKSGRENLKKALYGDVQRTKNLLQNHIDLQRLYQSMPSQLVVENMDQRTFVKRKELDRLVARRNDLSNIYRKKLIELARYQDRIKYVDVAEIKDDVLAKKLRMELKNSETRMRAIRTINRAYNRIIGAMMMDSIYFEPTLQALQDDLNEQSGFINKTIRMGLPALKNLQLLEDEYDSLEVRTRKDMQTHLADIYSHREVIAKNNEMVKKLVRHDSDFTLFPNRYNRETTSMMKLKTRLDEVEKIMKAVKKATSCYKSEIIYPRLKKQKVDNKRLEDSIVYREKEKVSLEKRDNHAAVIKESLLHNLTDSEIVRNNEIKLLKKHISEQKKIQVLTEKELKENGEIVCLLRTAFQHYNEVVTHIGDPHIPEIKAYPTSDLNLPLLSFAGHAIKSVAPSPNEDDVESLLKITKIRVKQLMDKYNAMIDKERDIKVEQMNAENMIHRDITKDLFVDSIETNEDQVAESPLVFTAVQEDPNVPNRNLIKFMSKKIVEINAKAEDD